MNPASSSPPSFPESPYRVPAQVGDAACPPVEAPADPALAWMALAFVLASLLRAAHPLFGHEIFGAEPTLALFAALLVGHQLARDARLRLVQRRWSDAPDERATNTTLGGAQRC
jgi:hypothetical protein